MHELRLLPSAQRDLDDLDKPLLRRLFDKILALKADPRPVGAVKLTADDGYRLRVGDYRVLYRVEDRARVVYIYRVKHRKEVYR